MMSQICGIVTNYIASTVKRPGISSHQHHLIHDMYGTIRGKILRV